MVILQNGTSIVRMLPWRQGAPTDCRKTPEAPGASILTCREAGYAVAHYALHTDRTGGERPETAR